MGRYDEYIEAGVNFVVNKSFFIKQQIAQAIIIFIASFPAVILKSYWCFIPAIMICTYFIALSVMVILLQFTELTVKTRLLLQTVLYAGWVIHLIMFQTQYFILGFGVNPFIVSIYIPPIVIPIVLAITNGYKLRNRKYKNYKPNRTSIVLSFSFAGVLGSNLAAFLLKDLSQQGAILVGLICFSIVTNFMSIGLLSIHRLYYLLKFSYKER